MAKGFYPYLQQAVGLHERLQITYVVDGYSAEIINEQEEVLESVEDETISRCLDKLELRLATIQRAETEGG